MSMFCPHCGSELPDSAQFCGSCGNAIAAGPQSAPQPAVQASWNAPAASVSTASAQTAAAAPDAGVAAAPRSNTRLIALGIIALLAVAAAVAAYMLFFAPYRLSERNVPDQSLRMAIAKQCDFDGDGKIARKDAKAVESLNLASSGVANLEGIQLLPNLHELDLSSCKSLVAADLSKLPALTKLNAAGSTLETIDVSSLRGLQELDLSSTNVKTLDVSRNANLSKLSVEQDVEVTGIDSTNLREQWVLSGYSIDGYEGGVYESYFSNGGSPAEFTDVSYVYDDQGRLVQADTTYGYSGSSGTESNTYSRFFTYDEDANTIMESNGTGGDRYETLYEYNDSGQLVSSISTNYSSGSISSESETNYEYSEDGLLQQRLSGSSVEKYTYNDNGQLVEVASRHGEDQDFKTSLRLWYNEDGTLSAFEVPATWESDDLGRTTFDYNETGSCVAAHRVYNGDPNGDLQFYYSEDGTLSSGSYVYTSKDGNNETQSEGTLSFNDLGLPTRRVFSSTYRYTDNANTNESTTDFQYQRVYTAKDAPDVQQPAGYLSPLGTIHANNPYTVYSFFDGQPDVVKNALLANGLYSYI